MAKSQPGEPYRAIDNKPFIFVAAKLESLPVRNRKLMEKQMQK